MKTPDQEENVRPGILFVERDNDPRPFAFWLEPYEEGYLLSLSIPEPTVELLNVPCDWEKELRERVSTHWFPWGPVHLLDSMRVRLEQCFSTEEPHLALTLHALVSRDGKTKGQTFFTRDSLQGKKVFTSRSFFDAYTESNNRFHDHARLAGQVALGMLRDRLVAEALNVQHLLGEWQVLSWGAIGPLPQKMRRAYSMIRREFITFFNSVLTNMVMEQGGYLIFTAFPKCEQVREVRESLVARLPEIMTHSEDEIMELNRDVRVYCGRSEYSHESTPHPVLNIPAYATFDSPTSRYVDLINVRVALAVLKDQDAPYTKDDVRELASHITQQRRSENILKLRDQISLLNEFCAQRKLRVVFEPQDIVPATAYRTERYLQVVHAASDDKVYTSPTVRGRSRDHARQRAAHSLLRILERHDIPECVPTKPRLNVSSVFSLEPIVNVPLPPLSPELLELAKKSGNSKTAFNNISQRLRLRAEYRSEIDIVRTHNEEGYWWKSQASLFSEDSLVASSGLCHDNTKQGAEQRGAETLLKLLWGIDIEGDHSTGNGSSVIERVIAKSEEHPELMALCVLCESHGLSLSITREHRANGVPETRTTKKHKNATVGRIIMGGRLIDAHIYGPNDEATRLSVVRTLRQRVEREIQKQE